MGNMNTGNMMAGGGVGGGYDAGNANNNMMNMNSYNDPINSNPNMNIPHTGVNNYGGAMNTPAPLPPANDCQVSLHLHFFCHGNLKFPIPVADCLGPVGALFCHLQCAWRLKGSLEGVRLQNVSFSMIIWNTAGRLMDYFTDKRTSLIRVKLCDYF